MAEYDDDLRKLGDVLADSRLRKAFWTDPDRTLEQQGVKKDRIPAEVLDTLQDLSFEELRFLSRFREPLLRAVDRGVDPIAVLKMV